ncbi:MAG: CvpA family protein [Candidatus Aminicenantes bacterium]|nr:MAG: CvpA family protein [Candidatus Aminicenantes bacterium]
MDLNWVDILLIVILIITVVLGLIKGFIRQIIGILAVIIGLILAVNFYPFVSDIYSKWISHKVLPYLLGFLTIFLAVLAVGWLISHLLSKMMKGPLKFANHVLGGGIGLLKGILICGVVVFAFLLFPVNKEALKASKLSPTCVQATKAVFFLIPQEIKDQFQKAYQDIMGKGAKNGREV